MVPHRKKQGNHVKRLAEGIPKAQEPQRTRRTRKNPIRPQPGGNPRRAMATQHQLSPLARLMGALRAEKIQFQLIGMSAAILQGVPVATFDVDLWLDLPVRKYMRAVNLAVAHGAKLVRNTVVELDDGTLVNFIFEVTGLQKFANELRKARKLSFHGLVIPVMPL